jgi:hypothetical protein
MNHDRTRCGRRRGVNVSRGDRIDPLHLDRPTHLARSRIDAQSCRSATVRVPLIRHTRRGDLCRTPVRSTVNNRPVISADAGATQASRTPTVTTRQMVIRRTDDKATPATKEIPECSVTGFGAGQSTDWIQDPKPLRQQVPINRPRQDQQPSGSRYRFALAKFMSR